MTARDQPDRPGRGRSMAAGKAAAVSAAAQAAPLPQPPWQQVLDAGVADTVNDVLTGLIDGPYKGRTGRAASIHRPAAGNTGTTNSSLAAWFAGYTPGLATAVWVGRPVPVDMERIRIGGRYHSSVYGGTIPARIWRATMRAAVAGTPRQEFPRPPRPLETRTGASDRPSPTDPTDSTDQ